MELVGGCVGEWVVSYLGWLLLCATAWQFMERLSLRQRYQRQLLVNSPSETCVNTPKFACIFA